jgi:hypothetical protein
VFISAGFTLLSLGLNNFDTAKTVFLVIFFLVCELVSVSLFRFTNLSVLPVKRDQFAAAVVIHTAAVLIGAYRPLGRKKSLHKEGEIW